jgi:hypothetical protein
MELNEDSDIDSDDDYEAGFKKHKSDEAAKVEGESKYIDLNFVVGSAAIVESMWSELDDLLCNKRRSCMSPLNVEMIMFLKKNKDLWSLQDVHLANSMRKKAMQDKRNGITDDDADRVAKRIHESEVWDRWMAEE